MDRLLRETSRRPWLTYAAAVTLAFAAFGVSRAFEPLLGDRAPFLFYFPAVMAVAFLGGLRPGLVATAVAVVLLRKRAADLPILNTAVFVMTGVFASVVSELARRAIQTSAELRKAREQLLAIVAHDLRNPLNAVVLSTRTLRAKSAGDGERAIATIERAAARMEYLIRDLVDATRLETDGHLPIVEGDEDPRSIVAEAIEAAEPHARAKGVALDASLPSRLPKVRADRDRVLQVLGNLLGNAIKFTPAGGQITVRIAEGGSLVRFEVADTGPGIAAADMPRLFERHWKGRASGGTGLGLYIAAGIVRAHGGRIWCHSEPGFGASFFFVLPVAVSDGPVATPRSESFRLS